MSAMASQSISRTISMQIQLDGGGRAAMPCTLAYSVEDPFAVSATFHSSAGDVTWVFARELLSQGFGEPAGTGDIVIAPLSYGTAKTIRMELNSPSGQAVMHAPREGIEEFLAASEALLPTGHEWVHLNFDAGLAGLLGNGGSAQY